MKEKKERKKERKNGRKKERKSKKERDGDCERQKGKSVCVYV